MLLLLLMLLLFWFRLGGGCFFYCCLLFFLLLCFACFHFKSVSTHASYVKIIKTTFSEFLIVFPCESDT